MAKIVNRQRKPNEANLAESMPSFGCFRPI